ncbi:hypothetical protein F4553_006305 [Allocatelliglobosispora scoriae]|uniref:Secreted protein n=1 Tax=Allocatelliglobosispora scoriae TaxID=643052 RepID=A0A841C1X7_9ACTN|nr:hypothetical protein [Allocatelliglobosispora scoriae]MBB5872871.1 hypothetical protein [Allocatelliglobosispora scoriae]
MISRSVTALLLAAGATLAAVAPAAPAHARACTIMAYCVTNWYTGPSKTTLAGAKYEDCNGNQTVWGTTTAWVTFTETFC